MLTRALENLIAAPALKPIPRRGKECDAFLLHKAARINVIPVPLGKSKTATRHAWKLEQPNGVAAAVAAARVHFTSAYSTLRAQVESLKRYRSSIKNGNSGRFANVPRDNCIRVLTCRDRSSVPLMKGDSRREDQEVRTIAL